MTWKAVLLFIKKAYLWFKHYWYIPAVLAYTLLMWVVFRRDVTTALGVLELTKDSYKKQVDVLNKTHQEEIAKRDKIIKEYNEVISKLETDYQDNIRNLDKSKKKRVKDLVESYHENPDELSRMLSEVFGIHSVK